MSIAEHRLAASPARNESPRRWLAIVLALFLTPGLAFLQLAHMRLASFYFLYALGLIALFAGLFFLDFDLLRNMPYAFVYMLMVNIAGALHAASVPIKPAAQNARRWYNNFLAVLAIPVLFAMLVYAVLTIAPTFRMPNPSMEPTLALTRPFMVLLPAYHWLDPERGDLVLYRSRSDIGEVSRVSRIIGLPGDSIAMEAGIPLLNGVPLPRIRLPDYPLREGARIAEVPCFMEILPDGTTYSVLEQQPGHAGRYHNHPVYHVPADAYFVISDNRDIARDSRDMQGVGFVTRDKIVGKAIALQITPDSRWHWRERWRSLWAFVGL